MFGLTTLGTIHTAISLVALAAGFTALARHGEIWSRNGAGRIYVIATVLTCLTGLPIFRHGGFGPPHALAIVTLVVLAVAYAGERAKLGRASRYGAVLGYSFSLFLHFVPATVETLTRFPLGAPYLANADDTKAQPIIGVFFAIFLVGAVIQFLRLRSAGKNEAAVDEDAGIAH